MAPAPAPQLAPVWQRRFSFYSHYGHPNGTPQARAAYKALSFWERVRLSNNFLAFFFGPFYFMVKGMWRKGLVLLVAGLTVGTLLATLGASDSLMRAVSFGFAYLAAMSANYAYYLHVTRQSTSWNPFEGLFNAKTPNA